MSIALMLVTVVLATLAVLNLAGRLARVGSFPKLSDSASYAGQVGMSECFFEPGSGQ